MQRERRACACARLHGDAPAHSLQVALHEAQAQSCARHGRSQHALAAIKRLEQMRQVRRRNPGAAVGDDELYFVAVLRRAHAQPTTGGCVFLRVVQQVLDDAFEGLRVGSTSGKSADTSHSTCHPSAVSAAA